MFYIYCGDNSVESRRAYADHKQKVGTNTELIELTVNNLVELNNWLYAAQALFSKKKAFYGEDLLSKKEEREFLKQFEDKPETDFLLWEEEMSDRDVKRYFAKSCLMVSKLPANIFTLLDSIFPGNLKKALFELSSVVSSVEENILLFMLERRIRELITLKLGIEMPKKQAWQTARLKSQGAKWPEKSLMNFYDGLYRIEANIKSGQTPLPIKKLLDILFIYYL